MPELVPADRTVKALIVALLEMPLDAQVEVWGPEPLPYKIAAMSLMPNVAYGQQYVRMEVNDA